MSKNKWVVLFVATALLSAVAPVLAVMPLQVTYTDSFGEQNPIQANWGTGTGLIPSVTLELKQFDPSLGTLERIHLDLRASATGSLKFENRDSIPETITSDLGATVTIGRPTDPASFVANLVLLNKNDSVTKYDGLTDFAGGSGRTYADLSTASDSIMNLDSTSSRFGSFIGSGMISLPTSAIGASSLTGSSNLSSTLRSFAEADLTVTYTYAPFTSPIPEPASLGLLLVGLLALRPKH